MWAVLLVGLLQEPVSPLITRHTEVLMTNHSKKSNLSLL